MPILAGIPVIRKPIDLTDRFADTRTLALRSLDGVDLLPFGGGEFFSLPGIEGLDLPPREIITEPVPGIDGARLREIRIQPRDVFLPLFLGSDSSHLDYLDRRDELARLFNHRTVNYRVEEGTLDLVANSRDGERERALRCIYIDGMKDGYGTSADGAEWASLGLNFLAVRPYWAGTPWATPTIYNPVGVPWFGAFPGSLSATRALGANIPILVDGDVPSWPRVDLVGPCTSVLITAPGLRVSIPAGLSAGETASIITDPRRRTAMFGGLKDWARVAPSDTYRPFAPGDQMVNIMVAGATSGVGATSAVVSGDTLFERPW